jgi:hypothetical protein
MAVQPSFNIHKYIAIIATNVDKTHQIQEHMTETVYTCILLKN